MTVLRYILQNPMKAGMEFSPGKYRWSSYRAYEKGEGSITDTEYAETVFGSRENLIAFCNQDSEDTAMDEDDINWRIQDDEAIGIMNRISKCGSVSEFQQLDRDLQKIYVRELYLEKLSKKQINRITGMSPKTIIKVVKEIDPEQLTVRNALKFRELDETEYKMDDIQDEVW